MRNNSSSKDDGPRLASPVSEDTTSVSTRRTSTSTKTTRNITEEDNIAKNKAKTGGSNRTTTRGGPRLAPALSDDADTTTSSRRTTVTISSSSESSRSTRDSSSSYCCELSDDDAAAEKKKAIESNHTNQVVVVTADANGICAPPLVSVTNNCEKSDEVIKNQASSSSGAVDPTSTAKPGTVVIVTSDDDNNQTPTDSTTPGAVNDNNLYSAGNIDKLRTDPGVTDSNLLSAGNIDKFLDDNNDKFIVPPGLYGDKDYGDEPVNGGGTDETNGPTDGRQENNNGNGQDRPTNNDGMISYEPVSGTEEGLAVAVAINEEDEDDPYENVHLMPDAIEYDPDSKPPLYKNRKFRFYAMAGGVVVLILVVVIIVAIVLGFSGSDGTGDENNNNFEFVTFAPTGTPTIAPTTTDVGRLQTIAKSLIMPSRDSSSSQGDNNNNIITDFDTYLNENATDTQRLAYEYAIDWILYEDPMKLTLASTNFEQRFLLAYFYYHVIIEGEKLLGKGKGWLTCGKPTHQTTDECDLAIFNRNFETDEPYYTYEAGNIRWLSGYTECSWAGVFCDENDEVAAIDLFAQDFSGPLPRELASISTLQFVGLSYNLFTGTIPSEFASLGRLINVEFNGQLLSGEFPTEYLNSFALQRLNLGMNDLTGSLVSEMDPSVNIGNLQALKGLFVEDNDLSGPFPTDIGSLEFLSYTRLERNDFDPGSIPTELGQLTLLQELWLGWCSFTGPVPSEFGMLTELTDLRFEHNDLTGPLPDELFELTDLKWFFLEFNRLTGTLSPMVSQWEELEQLRLRFNEFTGTIPTEFGLLKELMLGFFQLNQFDGPIPDEMCANSAIPGIGEGNGKLAYLNADCLGDDPATPCTKYCCTACCSRETELCFVDRDK